MFIRILWELLKFYYLKVFFIYFIMCFCLFVDLEGIKEKSIKIRFRYWEFCDVWVKNNKFDRNINLSVFLSFVEII